MIIRSIESVRYALVLCPLLPVRLKRSAFATCLVIVGFWADYACADVAVTAEAEIHFRAGVDHLQGDAPDRYEHAYREFKAAYADSPTWKILGNLGIAALKLERYGEAIDAFEEYLEKGKGELSPDEVEQVRRDLNVLLAEQATVTVVVIDRSLLITDERRPTRGIPIVNRYGPFERTTQLRVRAGKHEVSVERADGSSAIWQIALQPGDTVTKSFEPVESSTNADEEASSSPPPEDESPQISGGVYLLWGTATLAGGAAAFFYWRSTQVQSEADTAFRINCPDGVTAGDARCGSTTAGDSSAAGWRTAALLTGVGAVSALVAGTTLYWLGTPTVPAGTKGRSSSKGGALRGWVNLGGVGLSGTF